MHGAFRGVAIRILVVAALAAIPAMSAAQWVQTSGPKGGAIRSLLATTDNAGQRNLFAGHVRVWRTGDGGATWTRPGAGPTDPNAFALLAVPNGAGGNDVLVGTNAGVFRSTDQGATWSSISNGLTNPSIYALAAGPNGAGGTNLYAGAYLGNAFRSSDNGATWTAASSGLPVGQANVTALLTTPTGTVIAGTMNGIYRSTNFGASWTRVFTLYGLSLVRHGATLYAGTTNGVYKSTNDGATWTPINNGMAYNWVQSLAAVPNGSGVVLFANLMRSVDGGATWTFAATGIANPDARAFAWAPTASGGTDVYVGTGRGVFRSSDFGSHWTDVSFIATQVQALEVTPTGALLASSEIELFRTTDAGTSWIDTRSMTTALDFAFDGTAARVFACSSPAGIYASNDDGATWTPSSNNLGDFDVNSIAAVPNGTGGTNLLAGTYSESFISTDHGGTWSPANLQTLILDHLATPNGAGGHDLWAAGFGGVWRSTNYGTAWTSVSSGIAGQIVQAIAATGNGANLFAGGDPFGVYRSTNGGASWSPANNGIGDLRIVALFSPDGANLFAAGAGGVYLSTDHGTSWTSVGTGLATGVCALASSRDGTTLFAGTTGFGVWKRPLSEMTSAPPPPPPATPVIASFTPASGTAGTVVTITGSNFAGTSAVTFNLVAASFTVVSGTQVRATVPAGASTGRIRVTTPAGTATSGTDFGVAASPPPATLTFVPAHDAYVRSTSPSSNFGARTDLDVKAAPQTMRSYLKFQVSGVSGTVQAARLRLRVVDASDDGGFVHAASNDLRGTSTPWTENGLTWDNAPAPGPILDFTGRVTAGAWVEVDVTSAVTGNGTYSFAVSGGTKDQAGYSSSEGTDPPQLVVIASGSAVMLAGGGASRLEAAPGPGAVALHAGQPNPFVAGTTLRYSLPRSMVVRLVVYDVTGRIVRTLVDGAEPAGERRVEWDGRDAAGSRVRAGTYLCRLEADGMLQTRKLAVMR